MFVEKDQLIPDFCHLCHFSGTRKGESDEKWLFYHFLLVNHDKSLDLRLCSDGKR